MPRGGNAQRVSGCRLEERACPSMLHLILKRFIHQYFNSECAFSPGAKIGRKARTLLQRSQKRWVAVKRRRPVTVDHVLDEDHFDLVPINHSRAMRGS